MRDGRGRVEGSQEDAKVELIVGTCWDMIVWSLNDGHYYWSESDILALRTRST